MSFWNVEISEDDASPNTKYHSVSWDLSEVPSKGLDAKVSLLPIPSGYDYSIDNGGIPYDRSITRNFGFKIDIYAIDWSHSHLNVYAMVDTTRVATAKFDITVPEGGPSLGLLGLSLTALFAVRRRVPHLLRRDSVTGPG